MIQRILIIANGYPSDDDPVAGAFVEEQAVVLARRYQVTVVVAQFRGWRSIARHGLGAGLTTEVRRGIPVFRPRAIVAVPRALSSGPALWSYRSAVAAGYRAVVARYGRPQVIHAHMVLEAGWAAVQVARDEGVPVVLTEHTSPFSAHLRTPLSRSRVRQTLADADAVLTVGPALREEVLEVIPERKNEVEVLGNVIDTAFFIPGSDRLHRGPADLRIATIGILTPQKGIDLLLDACGRLADSGIAFRLEVGGDGPSRADLEQQAQRLGLGERVSFLGRLTRSQVRDALQRADLFVLASRNESFGVVVAEAMACGLPVVVTRSGGPEAFVPTGTGVVVEPGDPAALANAIAGVAAGRTPVDGLLGRAEIVRRFSPDAYLSAIDGIYERVVAARG